jgi:Phosphotransferase system, mannose/fructose/N-acetylgalactosamine-specific component IID
MKFTLTAQEKKDMFTLFKRSFLFNGSMQAIKRQGMGFTYALIPLLDRIYGDDKEAKIDALKRHDVYINTHASTGTFLLGLAYALEKSKAEGENIDGSVITGIKASLMGPLAGIGDSIFHITLRVIGAGIGITFAQEGSILGAFIFLTLYGGVFLAIKYPLIVAGYTLGTTYLKDLFEKGLLRSISKAASILGLTMVGALTASLIKAQTAVVIRVGGTEVALQSMFDAIMPKILSIVTLFVVYKLVKNKVSVIKIVFGMIAFGILMSFLKIM